MPKQKTQRRGAVAAAVPDAPWLAQQKGHAIRLTAPYLTAKRQHRPRPRTPSGAPGGQAVARRRTPVVRLFSRSAGTPTKSAVVVTPMPPPKLPKVFQNAAGKNGACVLPEDFAVDSAHMIGKGGFGSVFPVVHKADPTTPLVVKTIKLGVDAYHDDMALREVAIMQLLRGNAHVLQLACFVQKPGELQIILDRCDGNLVDARLSGSIMQSAVRQTVEGLAFVHSKGFIHFDVKPDNLLHKGSLAKLGFVIKVSDFGLSCSKDPDFTGQVPACVTRYKAGTLDFMAPEIQHAHALGQQATSKDFDKISYPADVWSLGCTIAELAGADLEREFSTDEAAIYFCNTRLPKGQLPGIREVVLATHVRNPSKRAAMVELLRMPYLQ